MSYYKTVRTTSGHRYVVRMAGDAAAERWIGWIVSALVTFAGSAGMFLLWIKMG